MGNLTEKSLRAVKPKGKIYRVTDGNGLTLEVWPNGGRYWRIRYRFGGKEKQLSFGVYPEVTLKEARDRLAEARALLRDGIDPSRDRKEGKASQRTAEESNFVAVSNEWLALNQKSWASATYRKAAYVLTAYLQPSLKEADIATLATPEARRTIAVVASKAPALAEKARGYLSSIVEFAINGGLRKEGASLSLKGTVPKRQKGHIAAATTPEAIKTLLTALDSYDSPVTRAALTVTMLTALRPGVVAGARWAEINLDAAEWHVPPERMKTRNAHVVPLPRQAVNELREMVKFTAGTDFVFPPLARQKTAHLHRDALSKALRNMGLQGAHATHGFRGMLRTVARERLGIPADVLEAQLAHAKRGDVQKAYDRTQFLDERKVAMQSWADYLDGLRMKR